MYFMMEYLKLFRNRRSLHRKMINHKHKFIFIEIHKTVQLLFSSPSDSIKDGWGATENRWIKVNIYL